MQGQSFAEPPETSSRVFRNISFNSWFPNENHAYILGSSVVICRDLSVIWATFEREYSENIKIISIMIRPNVFVYSVILKISIFQMLKFSTKDVKV